MNDPKPFARGIGRVVTMACFCGSVQAGELTPGSDAPACRNMLTPGSAHACSQERSRPAVERYGIPPQARGITASADRGEPASDPVSEKDVDDFLASYGKPPRSAVRALLDPTDGNIAAMRVDQSRREIVAAYVAQRLTELQARDAGPATVAEYRTLPYLVGMQVTAFVDAACEQCEELYRMLRRFIAADPIVDVRLAVVADSAEQAPLGALLTGGLAVPASTVSRQDVLAYGISALPAIMIEDLRSRRRRVIPADADSAQLHERIVAMRRQPS